MIKKCAILMVLCFFLHANAQQEATSVMVFHPKFGADPLEFNKNYVTQNNDTVRLGSFRCYISAIELRYSDGVVFQQPGYHLLDAAQTATLSVPVSIDRKKILSQVAFNIGVDSTASVSGAMSGDLDPANGMYWAWQSGYINLKIEGSSPNCKTRKNAFQFHIGGYLHPYCALRKVTLAYDKRTENIPIAIDLKRFFEMLRLSQTNSVMVPGATAMQLADESVKMFSLQ